MMSYHIKIDFFMLNRSHKKVSPSAPAEETKVSSSTDVRPQKTCHDPSFGTKVSGTFQELLASYIRIPFLRMLEHVLLGRMTSVLF